MSLNIECPSCGATLTYNSDQSICTCEYCKITYTIKDGKLKKARKKSKSLMLIMLFQMNS